MWLRTRFSVSFQPFRYFLFLFLRYLLDSHLTLFRLLVRKQEGKRPLRRPRRRWVDNMKIDLGEIRWEVDCIVLAQGRYKWRALVNAIMNLRVPKNVGRFSSGYTTGGSRVVLSSIELVS
jgi:hypothetical protein